MFINELNSILSMQCVIELRDGNTIEEFSRKFNLPLLGVFRAKGDRDTLTYFLPTDISESREARVFIDMFKGRREDDMWTFYADSRGFPSISYVRQIHDIPSVVLDGLILADGSHILLFRFHASRMSAVSDLLISIISKDRRVKLLYYGKTGGFTNLLDRYSQKFPLTVVKLKYSSTEPQGNAYPYYLETKFHSLPSLSRSIIYLKKGDQITNGDKVIKCTELEFEEHNELLETLLTDGENVPVCTISRIRKIFKGETELEIIIPDSFKKMLLRRIYWAIKRFSDMDISLQSVSRFLPSPETT